MRVQRLLSELWAFRKTVIIVLTPFLLSPLPILVPTNPARCGYVIMIMAVYWTTEALPMAVTALLPVVLMPLLGVRGSKDLCRNYLKDTNMLFVSGLIVAVAVEKWSLHKRIALRVLLLVGSQPKWLMFGLMTTTAFLSMWISNTATAAMMVPIAQAVLSELEDHRAKQRHRHVTTTDEMSNGQLNDVSKGKPKAPSTIEPLEIEEGTGGESPDVGEESQSADDVMFSQMCKGVTICIAYAANIGGTATLTGTGPNVVIKGQVDSLYGDDSGINFSSWFIYAFPNMVLTLFLAWIWLQVMFLGPRSLLRWRCTKPTEQDRVTAAVIAEEYRKLGPMTFAERAVLGHFILLAVLWITREPEFVPGWSVFFTPGYVTDASTGLVVATLLFIFPSSWPNFMCFRKKSDDSPAGPRASLLDWKTVALNLPWGLILLLGGGFALADACKASGLSAWVGQQFTLFQNFPAWAMVLLICLLVAAFTEVTSNVATATIFLPVLAELAVSIRVHPLYLMIPATISTSFAFMVPVATPPNAIVFTYGRLKIKDMVRAGIVMNIVCVLILTFSINTWGMAYFRLDQFPAWAADEKTGDLLNTTMAGPTTIKT